MTHRAKDIKRRHQGKQDDPDMIRLVRDREGTVIADLQGKLPGPAVRLACSRTDIVNAVQDGSLEQAFCDGGANGQSKVPADLADRIEDRLRQFCLDWLGMAYGAGQLITGFDAVRDALRGDRAALLIEAKDASRRQAAKLRAGADDVPVCRYFTAGQLSLALGRGNVVHAALPVGSLAEAAKLDFQRLQAFCGEPADTDTDRSTTDMVLNRLEA